MENQKKVPPAPPQKDKAVFKLIVYFKDGSARTYYNYHTSWNSEFKRVVECERTALKKLQNFIGWKLKDRFKTAIFIHIPTDKIFEKYVYGNLMFALDYTFAYVNGKVVFKLVDQSKLKVA